MVVALSLLPLSGAVLSIVLILVSVFGARRWTPAIAFFILLNAASFLWTTGYFIQINWLRSADPTLVSFASPGYALLILVAVGGAGAPTYWFLFALASSARAEMLDRRVILLAHVPMVYTILVLATNPLHHLFSRAGANGVVYGPLAPFHHIGTFVLVLAGAWLLVESARAEGGKRGLMVATAAVVPMAAGLLWTTRHYTGIPLPVNPTPVIFPVLTAVLGLEVFRTGLADIVPVTTLRAIMDHTDTSLAFLDPDFTFVSANSAYVRGIPHTEGEIVGRHYFDLFPDEERRRLFEGVHATREPVQVRADPKEEAGRITYSDWTLAPVHRAGKVLEGFVLSAVDVTEAVREQELSRTLNEVQAEVHSSLNLDRTIHAVAMAASAALGSSCASVVLRRDGAWQALRHCERRSADWEPYAHGDLPDVDVVLATREPLVVSDALHDDRLDPYIMEALGFRAVSAMPLFDGKGIAGVLSFEDQRARRRFAQAEVEFAERVAEAASRSLQNARLYHAEHQIAATLQESMLSLPDTIERLEFAHLYRSATESALVGGDFYDIFEPSEGHVALVIGDVSGKGIDAAVLTSLIKTTIRVQAYETGSPGEIMTRANEFLRQQFALGVFATVFFGMLETATGELTYCSAGHPPAFIRRTDGVLRLEGHDPILGIFEATPFTSSRVDLAGTDTLVLYTDGLTEASGPSDRFGEERLESLLREAAGSPSEIVGRVFERVMEFAENRLSDDLALLAVRLKPPSMVPAQAANAS